MSKDPIGTLVRNESLRKVLSVLLTVAMVLQGFSYRGLTTAYAEEALPEEYVVNDEGSDDQQVEVVLDSSLTQRATRSRTTRAIRPTSR